MPVFNKMVYNGTEYILGGGGNIGEPLNLTVTTSGLDATIKWEDNEIGTIPPTTFQKSELVRKIGSAPTSPSDGTLVVTETVKDTYKNTGYVDSGLTDGTTYYYRVFSYSDLGGISYCDAVSVTPSGLWIDLDISTATLDKQFSTGYGYQGLYINPDEDVAITSSYGEPGKIRGYTYSNKDISTASLEGTQTPSNHIHCVYANAAGTHIYYGTHADGYVYEYSTTNWSVANMTSYKSMDFGVTCQCVWVDSTEKYIVIGGTGNNGDGINLYEMSTPGDVSTATLVTTGTVGFNIHGVVFNDSLTKCVMCEYSASSGTVHQYDWDILHTGSPTQTHTFGPVGFTIGYANINEDGTTMYAARENGYIYQYTLS